MISGKNPELVPIVDSGVGPRHNQNRGRIKGKWHFM